MALKHFQENNLKNAKQQIGPILGPLRLFPDVSNLDSFHEEIWKINPNTILIPIGKEITKVTRKKVEKYHFKTMFGL